MSSSSPTSSRWLFCGSGCLAVPLGLVILATILNVFAPQPKPKATPTATPTPKLVATKRPKITVVIPGRSEAERKQIFKELCDASERAQREADQKISPTDSPTQNMELSDQLLERYEGSVRTHYNLTSSEWAAILKEGGNKQWPPLLPKE